MRHWPNIFSMLQIISNKFLFTFSPCGDLRKVEERCFSCEKRANKKSEKSEGKMRKVNEKVGQNLPVLF